MMCLGRYLHGARGITKRFKACRTSALRFKGINRKGLKIAPARMRHMIRATTNGALTPRINDIEC